MLQQEIHVNTHSTPLLRFLEIAVLFLITLCYWAQYGFIGDLVGYRQVNYIELITTPIDKNIHFTISWSLFYSSALIVPFLMSWIIIVQSRLNFLLFYRIFFTCLLVLSIHYALYFLFPTQVPLWEDPGFITFWQTQDTDWLTANVRFIMSITSPWNSFPSYHIGSGWIILRYSFERFKLLSYIYLLWFIGMSIGAFTLKIHILLDGIVGIIISECAYQLFKTVKIQGYLQRFANMYPRNNVLIAYSCIALLLISLVTYQLAYFKPKFIPSYALEIPSPPPVRQRG